MNVSLSVWSDIACPWCFVGKANLEQAVAQLATEAPDVNLQIKWRAFELDPRPREPSTLGYAERLAAKYQRTVEQAQQMLDTMTQAISDVGGHADFSKVVPANTFNAHRLIQWAGDVAQSNSAQNQHMLTDAFMRGYLGQGLDLSNGDAMLKVVESLGLDRADAAGVLNSTRYAGLVRSDEQEAQSHGIRGVPFFVAGGLGLSGAQPASALVEAVLKAGDSQD